MNFLFFQLLRVLILLVICQPWSAFASLGNSFPSYKSCVENCRSDICDDVGYYFRKHDVITLPLMLLWKCTDDCQYRCMWGVVDIFDKKGWPTPQFHGKWPFVRIMGIQEPASTLFSVMNFFMHTKMFYLYLKKTRPNCPMYNVWVAYALTSLNGWFWSAVFHTRDTQFTELMDYLSAFAVVLCGIYAIGMRLMLGVRKRYSVIYTISCLLFYAYHALYLASGPFDYRYNLFANIIIGFSSAGICAFFLARNWSLPQCKKLGVAVLITTTSTYFEVNDFPPVFWILDAHALWHLTTFPAIYLFWQFVIEDSKYLLKTSFVKCNRQDQDFSLSFLAIKMDDVINLTSLNKNRTNNQVQYTVPFVKF